MSEEHTRDLHDGRSFEERVFVRFDAIESQFNRRFDGLDQRVESLNEGVRSLDDRVRSVETQAEKRSLETKPIWERALAEILEVKEGLGSLERKINLLMRDIIVRSCRPGALGRSSR